MILTLEVSIRAWYPTGETILPSTLADDILNVNVENRRLVGTGESWQTARVVLAELSLESFKDADAPHEAFHVEMNQLLRDAGAWLSQINCECLEGSRNAGLNVDIFVEVFMVDNQLELRLPVEFLGQVSRLQLPIELISDS